jgi:transcriptional regulator with XRE-family HTH domain
MDIPPDIDNFPSLIRWLIRTQDGSAYGMAKRLGVSTSLINQWLSGKTVSPHIRQIGNFCKTYKMEFDDVQAFIAGEKHQARPIPSEVVDMKSFVRWLAREHHNGTFAAMAPRIGVSTSLVYQWRDGVARLPSAASLKKLCRAYGYETSEVLPRISKER